MFYLIFAIFIIAFFYFLHKILKLLWQLQDNHKNVIKVIEYNIVFLLIPISIIIFVHIFWIEHKNDFLSVFVSTFSVISINTLFSLVWKGEIYSNWNMNNIYSKIVLILIFAEVLIPACIIQFWQNSWHILWILFFTFIFTFLIIFINNRY